MYAKLWLGLISGCVVTSVICVSLKPKIKSFHVQSEIKYTYARTCVISEMLNPANESQELEFSATLPEDAFITGFFIIIKGNSYEALVKEKEEAKKEYDVAVKSGQTAGHVFQTSARFSKLFSTSINIEAHGSVTFNLTYEELLTRKNGTYQNDLNINPHQIVEDMRIIVDIEDVLNIINVKVPQFKMTNEIDQSETSENPNVIKTILPKKVRLEWSPTTLEQAELASDGLNGKMVVQYDVDTSEASNRILVTPDGYFVWIYSNDSLPVINKHAIFVLDVSGSMMGSKIEQLKHAMDQIFQDLNENDYFSLILFSVKILPWKPEAEVNLKTLYSSGYYFGRELPIEQDFLDQSYVIPANKNNVKLAKQFINSVSSYGGTNINGALRVGLNIAKEGKKMFQNFMNPIEPLIIFLTDGQPNHEQSNPDKIIENVERLNKDKTTVFTLAFGNDADISFLKKLSLSNGGFMRKIYSDSDAAIQLKNFYREVASPILSNVKFEYLPDEVKDVSTVSKNLFLGSSLIISGRMKNCALPGTIIGLTPKGLTRFEIPFDEVICLPHEEGFLEKMWVYKTIKSLLDQYTVSKNKTIENEAKKLALKYKIVTPLTSLIVVKPNDSSVVDDNPTEGPASDSFSPQFTNRAIMLGSGYGMSLLSAPAPGPRRAMFNTQAAMPAFSRHDLVSFSRGMPRQDFPDTIMLTTKSLPPTCNKIHYTNVTWLNQTSFQDVSNSHFLRPPPEVDQNDVIALNETDKAFNSPSCLGTKQCRHFIHCALEEFADDKQAFNTYKCHIEPNFLGVCCPC